MKKRKSDTGETFLRCRSFFMFLLREANTYVPEMTRKYAEIRKNFSWCAVLRLEIKLTQAFFRNAGDMDKNITKKFG